MKGCGMQAHLLLESPGSLWSPSQSPREPFTTEGPGWPRIEMGWGATTARGELQTLQDSSWPQQALTAQLQCLWLPPSSGLNLPGEATLRHCGHPVAQPSSHLLKSQSILPWPDAKVQDLRPRQPLNHIILSGYLATASKRNPQARTIRDIYGLLTQSHH